MTFFPSSSLIYDSFNIPVKESNIEYSPSFDLINDNFNPKASSSNLYEDENIDNIYVKIYFIPEKKVDKKNKFIFKTETEKEREVLKSIKKQKKLNILIGIEIILLVKFKHII